MKRLILRDRAIPSILSYRKDGIYIKTPTGMINFNTIYMIDREQSLDLLENLIDKCECRKHYYQLNDLKKDILNERF